MYNLTRITPQADIAEPLSLAEAKLHLKVEEADEDELVRALVAAGREFCEVFTRRRLCTQTWELGLDGFPVECGTEEGRYGGAIVVPTPPLQSVTSITYTDVDGASQVLSPSLYTVDARSTPGRIVPAYGQSWPSTREVPNAVVVRFVCGFGAADDVPEAFKHAMRLFIGHQYRDRDENTPMPAVVERLLRQWRWGSYP